MLGEDFAAPQLAALAHAHAQQTFVDTVKCCMSVYPGLSVHIFCMMCCGTLRCRSRLLPICRETQSHTFTEHTAVCLMASARKDGAWLAWRMRECVSVMSCVDGTMQAGGSPGKSEWECPGEAQTHMVPFCTVMVMSCS